MSKKHPHKSGSLSKRKGHGNAFSNIAQHKREGKTLVPPFATVPGLSLQSWANDRLPEFVWAGLLLAGLERVDALNVFRRVISHVEKHLTGAPFNGTLSAIATLDDQKRNRLLEELCNETQVREILAPLVVLRGLPAWDTWQRYLKSEPLSDHWEYITATVASILWHQSQEATDCRWLSVMSMVVSGFLKLPSQESIDELCGYPHHGDQRKVRPSITAVLHDSERKGLFVRREPC
jgi:hypothetical protein